MPQTIARGATITLEAFYTDNAGDAVDPVTPLVSIIDANGDTVVDLEVPDNVATGHFTFDFEVELDALLGAWSAHWSGVINGAPVTQDDGFTVVDVGSITTPEDGPPHGFLATVAELAVTMRLPLDTIDLDTAADALAGAGDLIRAEVGQVLDFVADDVVSLRSTGGRLLLLPELPVTDVTLVRVRNPGGEWSDLTAGTDYEVELGRDGALWRIGGREWPQGHGRFGHLDNRGPRGWVEVTYSHGYALTDEFGSGLPEGIELLPPIAGTVAKRVAARGYVNPEAVAQETTGRGNAVVYGDTPGLYLSKRDIRDLVRLRPGTRGGSK